MSSITVSFSFHFWAAALTKAFPAASGECFTKKGQMISATFSFSRNSQTPSLAITMNLSSGVKSNLVTSKYIYENKWITWLCNDSNQMSLVITKRSTHSKTWRVFIHKPDSFRTEVFICRSFEGFNPATCLFYSVHFLRKRRLVVLAELSYLNSRFGRVGAHHCSRVTTVSN